MPANLELGDVIDRVSHAITKDSPAAVPRVQAKTYAATFDETGVHFSPHRPAAGPAGDGQHPRQDVAREALWADDPREGALPRAWNQQFPRPDPDTELTLRTRSVLVGDRVLYEQGGPSPGWSLLGNTAQTLLNGRVGLVEHHEAGEAGVRASWVLSRRPAGDGPLAIELGMAGLRYAGASREGIHLADASGTPRVRVGKAVAVDAAGGRSEVALVATNDALYLRVPTAVLAQATYPLAVDPLISPEFGMDEPVPVPRPGQHALAGTAGNGTNWLVVWIEWWGFESAVDVVAARVSKDGVVLDPLGILISRGEEAGSPPAVASNGTDFLVVWERLGFGPDICGARVTADGRVADPGGLVISNAPGDQRVPSVAGGSEGYLVVWQERRRSKEALDIYGARLSDEGAVLDGDGFLISAAPGDHLRSSVARGPGGYFVAWQEGAGGPLEPADISGARVSLNGTVQDINGLVLSSAPQDQMYPRVAANAAGFLVVWHDRRNSTVANPQTDVYGTLVSPAGEVSHPQGIPIATAPGGKGTPSVAADTDGFFVAWSDSRAAQPGIYGARVSPVGAVLDPAGVLVEAAADAYLPAVAASTSGFLVVWDSPSSSGAGIRGARLNRLAEVIDAQPILINAKANDQVSPAVASNGTNWLVVWQDWRNPDGATIYGTRLSLAGTVLDTTAVPISPRPGFAMGPAVASAGGDYLVVWTAAGYDIYGARVRSDGMVLDPGGIGICTTPATQTSPAVTSDGTDYLVVWNAGSIYAARVNHAGLILEPNGFPVSAGAGGHYTPASAFNGQEFLVVWSQSTGRPGYDDDIFGARVGLAGVVLDPAGFAISRAPNAQTSPAVASDGGNFLVVWADTRNTVGINGNTFGGHIYGARVGAEGRVLDPDGFLVSTGAFMASPSLTVSGAGYWAVWSSAGATPGPDSRVHAAQIDRDGSVLLEDLILNTNATYPGHAAVAAGPSGSLLVVGEGLRSGAARVVGNLLSLAVAPTIHSLTLAGDGATIAWRAEAGTAYRVQFKPDLSNANWFDLDPLVTATNSAASLRDSTLGRAAQRFYRVLELP